MPGFRMPSSRAVTEGGSVLMRPMPWPIRRSRYAGEERQYCCRNCANAAQTAPKNFRRGIRRIRNTEPESWAEHIKKAAREAELALFVCDASQPLTGEDRRAIEAAKCAPRSLALCNKSDLPAAISPDELPFDTVLTVSARTGAGLDALPALLEGWFLGENACDGSLLTNPRQFGALDRASRAIERAKTGLSLGVTPDAVLTDVEEAMAALGEVTGRTVREDITNRIFERFCVGK